MGATTFKFLFHSGRTPGRAISHPDSHLWFTSQKRVVADHSLSIKIPRSPALISKSQNNRRFWLIPEGRGGRPTPPRTQVHTPSTSHHLKDSAQTANNVLQTKPFPKMDQKHFVMSVGAGFQRTDI